MKTRPVLWQCMSLLSSLMHMLYLYSRSGDFADMLGEDYLGLRELGIAAEFGMSSLTIPKKLLKSKKSQLKGGPVASKPNEPPPLYPPPPPFIPLASNKVNDQIGLLKDYYAGRFTVLAAAAAAAPKPSPPLLGPFGRPITMLPGPSLAVPSLSGPNLSQPSSLLPGSSSATSVPTSVAVPSAPLSTAGLPSTNSIVVPGATTSATALPPQTAERPVIDWTSLPKLTLPDDTPSSAQVKMGPLGQITKGGGASGAGKKKGKGVVGAGATGDGVDAASTRAGSGGAPVSTVSGAANNSASGPVKKQKKAATGVGTGNGRKKKGSDGSTSGGGGTQQGNGAQGSPYPPVVVASA